MKALNMLKDFVDSEPLSITIILFVLVAAVVALLFWFRSNFRLGNHGEEIFECDECMGYFQRDQLVDTGPMHNEPHWLMCRNDLAKYIDDLEELRGHEQDVSELKRKLELLPRNL